MKKSVKHLEVYRQPKLILTVLHPLEECQETIAFASEPILSSLANILSYQAYKSTVESSGRSDNAQNNIPRPPNTTDYHFIDFELKYGIRQVSAFSLREMKLLLYILYVLKLPMSVFNIAPPNCIKITQYVIALSF